VENPKGFPSLVEQSGGLLWSQGGISTARFARMPFSDFRPARLRRQRLLAVHFPEPIHVQVATRAPPRARDVAQAGCYEHERAPSVGKRPHHARAAADLAVQPFERIVRAKASPVLARKRVVTERFLHAHLHHIGCT
jgi:hypothetical protein